MREPFLALDEIVSPGESTELANYPELKVRFRGTNPREGEVKSFLLCLFGTGWPLPDGCRLSGHKEDRWR